jgi:antitoxin HicB
MRYAFPCDIVRDEEEERATGREAFNVTFPDIPEAITCGWSWEEALEMAEDCLGASLSFYVDRREDIPKPSPVSDGQVLVPVPLIVAAKLTLYTAMRRQGITNVALAARLGVQENAVRRLVNPNHRSHISQVEKALRAVGRSLVVEDMAATAG